MSAIMVRFAKAKFWYGNTMSFSDGFRAMMEVNYLNNHTGISVHDLSAFQQHNYTDYSAQLAVPKIMSYISHSSNTTLQRAAGIFSGWNYSMESGSTAASLWFFTYEYLFNDVFMPCLQQIGWIPGNNGVLGVPSGMGGSLPNTTDYASLEVDLIHYILNDSAAKPARTIRYHIPVNKRRKPSISAMTREEMKATY